MTTDDNNVVTIEEDEQRRVNYLGTHHTTVNAGTVDTLK